MDVNTNLSRNLHNIIRHKGISQAYISKTLNVKPTTVNAWFRGANYPRYDTLERLANLLGVTTQDLLSDNFDYNSTIQEKRNFVKTPVANSTMPTPLPKVNEGGDDEKLLGKSKQFWKIMQIVDQLPVKKQEEVLNIIKVISNHQ